MYGARMFPWWTEKQKRLAEDLAQFVNEELGRIGFGMITFYGTTVYGLGSPLTHFGSEYLKEKYLAKLTRGEILGAVCLTEPQSGSDAASMELSAHRDGDCYILNGKKRFISNAG